MFKKERLLLFFLPLILAAPFLNRAYFVDDSYFVEIATWLKDHPLQPYDFRTDDAGLQNPGWEEDGFVRMVNPLAHHYFLAGLLRLGGEREWFLRLGCVLLMGLGALFLFELNRRWTHYPVLVSSLILTTPAFWLTSYSLLIDSTMIVFFLGGLYYFVRLGETGKWRDAVTSGIFMGLAILSKYPAIFILPLTGLWWILRRKKWVYSYLCIVPWILGLGMLLTYSWYTANLYGEPHILAASRRMVNVQGWPKYFVFFVFFSGVSIFPLALWKNLNRYQTSMGIIFLISAVSFLSSKLGGYTLLQSALLSVFAVTSLLFITHMFVQRKNWNWPMDFFIAGWVWGFVVMMLIVMPWVAGRYYLILIPGLALLAIRYMEMNNKKWVRQTLHVLLIGQLVLGAGLAYADYQQAEPSRRIGSDLQQRGWSGGERHFYLGDSFTVAYLKNYGWIPCFPQTELRTGDYVLAKEVTMPQMWFFNKGIQFKRLDVISYPSSFPLKVMSRKGSAGFYASVWGALPFTISKGPWEQFHLLEVVEVPMGSQNEIY